jgi:hypothetical protein
MFLAHILDFLLFNFSLAQVTLKKKEKKCQIKKMIINNTNLPRYGVHTSNLFSSDGNQWNHGVASLLLPKVMIRFSKTDCNKINENKCFLLHQLN